MIDDSEASPADGHSELLVKESRVSHTHNELFHYTTLPGLRGILTSNELWATSAAYLNDSSEMQAFWRHLEAPMRGAFEAAIEASIRENPAEMIQIEKLGGLERVAHREARSWIAMVRDRLFGASGVSLPFVVSFTTHSGDTEIDEYRRRHGMLSQWRGYAAGDGIAIVFDAVLLEHRLAQEAEAYKYWPLMLAEAVYEGVVRKFEPLVARLTGIACLVVEGRDAEGQALLEEVAEELGAAAARVKHRAFAEENECRIVVGLDPWVLNITPGLTSRHERVAYKRVLHRRGPTGSIPFLRLFEGSTERLPIRRIIVGPSRNQNAVFEDVIDLVDGRPIQVQASEIPYVGSI